MSKSPLFRVLLPVPLLAASIFAGAAASTWHDTKCTRYRAAWSAALVRQGPQGLGKDFLARHQAFLASNCTTTADVCSRTAEEFKLANTMVILAMNAGTASTFPPFACRSRSP